MPMKLSEIILNLTSSYPSISIKPGDTFYWSPGEKTVYYNDSFTSPEGVWALLHETGHALLDHEQYFTDIELLTKEVEAWERAKEIVDDLQLNITIDEDHIQDCLDSYRDWIHKRSLCPDCYLSGVQTDSETYTCVFCHAHWQVSTDRFCRPYRRKVAQ